MPWGLGHGIIVAALLCSEKRAARWTIAPLKQKNYQGKQPKKTKNTKQEKSCPQPEQTNQTLLVQGI